MAKKQNQKVTFVIDDKEYELKLTFEGIDYLNSVYDGGALALVGKAMTGDLATYLHMVYAGLLHTGESFTFKKVKSTIESQLEAEELDLDKVLRDGNALVANSFFYKKTVNKLLKNEDAKQAMEQLLN